MNDPRISAALVLMMAFGMTSSVALAQDAKEDVAVADKVLGDFEDGTVKKAFEDGTVQRWRSNGGPTKMTVEESDKAHGTKWLRMDLSKPNMWPGAWFSVRAGLNWSKYRALRFSVYNPYKEDIRFSILAEDTPGLGGYDSRYNRSPGLKLKPGPNDLEVTVGSIKMGMPGSCGQDVRTIHHTALFITDRGQPTTLYLDNVHLVAATKKDYAPLVLADFDGKSSGKYQSADEAKLAVVKRPVSKKGSALQLKLGVERPEPGIELSGFEPDWLSYDLLSLDVYCPADGPTPNHIAMKLEGAQGVVVTVATGLDHGWNSVQMPLDLAGLVALGKVKSLKLHTQRRFAKETFTIDNVRLERIRGRHFAGVTQKDTKGHPFVIDFSVLDQVGSHFGATVWLPLKDGRVREIVCTAQGRGLLKYSLSPEQLKDVDSDKAIRAWGHMRIHQNWFFAQKLVRLAVGKPTIVKFEDPTSFAR